MKTLPRISPYPVPELAEFLRPFRRFFARAESLHVLERVATGLIAEIENKSGAGIVAAVAGLSESALYRLMDQTLWDAVIFNRYRVRVMVHKAVVGDGMLIIDETGSPRKGTKSVGVAHQYCGQLGKTANCQVMVTADYVDPYYAWPVVGQLYLPEVWCSDQERRTAAGVPRSVLFRSKPEIALALIDEARTAGVPFNLVGADSLYGQNHTFLAGLDERHLSYVVAVDKDFAIRLPDEVREAATHPVRPRRQGGNVRTRPYPEQRADIHRADAVIAQVPDSAWHQITWRQGSAEPLRKQFTALRVHRSYTWESGPIGWLISERPLPDQMGDQKYYWSNLPAETPLARLAELAHRRPSIERTYQDEKSYTGLNAYPARRWHSFHRYLAIEMLVLSWLVLQQPPPEKPEIVKEPKPVTDPDEPVFPLRATTVSKRGCSPSSGVRAALDRDHPLAGADWPC